MQAARARSRTLALTPPHRRARPPPPNEPAPQEALDHNRLGSDTYRRLALGLAVLSAALLAMVVRYRDILSTGLLSEPALLGCARGLGFRV
jgi:hypothetical protein